jgi:predicted DNA-binding transcriptional regulator AlpA
MFNRQLQNITVQGADREPIRPKLSTRKAADFLGLAKSTLDKKRLDGTGPHYLKLGRRVLYDERDLESWVASNRSRHTSQIQGQ